MTNHNLLSRLSSIDWDFAGSYSDSPFSAIHFHPCRFASQLPATLIGLLSKPGELVLDPFAGSGTTLVEAQRLNRPALGIDLNPIAALAARAKTIKRPSGCISSIIRSLKQDATHHLGSQRSTIRRHAKPTIPTTVQTSKWYTPIVANELGILWSYIQELEDEARLIGEAAFSAILLTVCRETRHWGYVCDNTTPQGDNDAKVLEEFWRVLERLDRAYQDRDRELSARPEGTTMVATVEFLVGDAGRVLEQSPTASVDLVVTSPPYFGVCDYIKAQRLSMEWFGIDIETLRLQEIGARSKRRRGNAATEYVEGLRSVFAATRRCMKESAYLALIIGESSRREEVLSELRTMFKSMGFRMNLEINRAVSTQRRLAPSILGEHLFILSR
jgi:DNA modification methylase